MAWFSFRCEISGVTGRNLRQNGTQCLFFGLFGSIQTFGLFAASPQLPSCHSMTHAPQTRHAASLCRKRELFWAFSTLDPMPGCPWVFEFASRICARCNGLVFLWVRIHACVQRVRLSLMCSLFGHDRCASRILFPSPRHLSECVLIRKRGWCTIKRENKNAQPQ